MNNYPDLTNACAPFYYDQINSVVSTVRPGTLHTKNTALYEFFAKYLFQKALSVFKVTVPEEWDRDYLMNALMGTGYIAVLNTDRFGVIPQQCTLQGYNVFYRPRLALIVNPLFDRNYELVIGKQCEIIKLSPNYSGITDLVGYYADNMAMTAEGIEVNTMNSKLSYMFGVQNKSSAESMKKALDKVLSGEPAVFYDNSLKKADGTVPWEPFSQNLRENYITPDAMEALKRWDNMFNEEVGIPSANTDKKERMVTDEVMSNRIETFSKAGLWLDCLQDGAKKVKKMFGVDVKFEWRYDIQEMTGGQSGLTENKKQKEGGDNGKQR